MQLSFSIEEVRAATGIEKTKLYDAFNAPELIARKWGKRTIVLKYYMSKLISLVALLCLLGSPQPLVPGTKTEKISVERQCQFGDGLAFKRTYQADHFESAGHVNFDKVQMYHEYNTDGTITIISTSW